MSECFVLEVLRLKISQEVWKSSKSHRVVAFMEAMYHNHIVKSTDSKVYEGSLYALPWDDSLKRVQVNFFFIDDLLTMDIGTAVYSISDDTSFGTDGTTATATIKIYPSGGTVPVGRALIRVGVQEMYDDEQGLPRKVLPPQKTGHNFAVPGFRFKRLSRILHWERIRSFNISQTVQNNDVRTLLTCMDDVTGGDVSQEDIDPTLYKALQLAQYGSQYLLSCRKVMKDREEVLKEALAAFRDEEELLDLKLAKMRAREKALRRESRDLDDLTVEYSSALRELNPRLLDRLYKTYQDKLRPPPGRRRESEDDRAPYSDEEYPADRFARQKEYFGAQERYGMRERRDTGERRGSGPAESVAEQSAPAKADSRWASAQPTGQRGERLGTPSPLIRVAEGDPWHPVTATGATHRTSGPVPTADSTGEARRWGGPHAAVEMFQALKSDSHSDKSSEEEGKRRGPVSRDAWANAPPSGTQVAATAPKIIRSLSARTIAVNAEARKPAAAAETGREVHDYEVPTSVGDEVSHVEAPHPAASAEFAPAQSGWASRPPLNSMSRSLPAPFHMVQQSVGDASLASTAMSVDSLSAPAVHHAVRPVHDAQSPHTPATPATPGTEGSASSYEQVDMSKYILRDSPYNTLEGRSVSAGPRASVVSQESRDLYEEDLEPATPGPVHETRTGVEGASVDADESMLVEEFDDSVHMDHHPVRRAVPVAGTATAGSLVSVPSTAAAPRHAPVTVPASSPVPLSASKQTPQRGRPSASSPLGEYSMDGDSPFPDLSAGPSGRKDYNQLLARRANTSHISSNDNSYLLNHSAMSGSSASRPYRPGHGAGGTGGMGSADSTMNSDNYDMDTFEEDDPFGRSPAPNLNFTQISGGSGIDQSKSVSIDFMLPSESKDLNRHAQRGGSAGWQQHAEAKNGPSRSSVGSSGGVGRNTSYVEEDLSGEMGLFSPLGGTRGVSSGSGGQRGRDEDDDDVLMGTTRITMGGTQPFTPSIRPGLGNTLLNTGDFSRDSLGSGPRPGSGGETPSAGAGGASRAHTRKPSPFSPVHEHGGGDVSLETEEESSIAPPTYDSLLGVGGAVDDSARAGSVSLQASAQDSMLATSVEETQHIHPVEPEYAEDDRPQWQAGRAALEAVEMATALDVYVTAVRLDSQHARIYPQVQVKVEFLGVQSEASEAVTIARAGAVQAINFASHMQFSSAEEEEVLIAEIEEVDDALALLVHVIDADTREVIGSASVELWTMVEDSTHLLRKEVDIFNLDMSSDMGTLLLDVKGFRLLKKCALALRSRRGRR